MGFLIGVCIFLVCVIVWLLISFFIKPGKKIKTEKRECVFCYSESHHSLDCNDIKKFPRVRESKKKEPKEEKERCTFCGGEGHSMGQCPLFYSCIG